jgi:membrane associated rhomboid family serine protease
MPDPHPSFGSPGSPGPLDPAVAVSLLERAGSLAEQGDWPLAAATFGRVVGNRDPNLHTAALLGLAEARYRMDDDAGALQSWITATQAPETPLSWRAWQQLAAARVRGGDLSGAARAYREAERRAPSEERQAIATRLGWLSKEMGDSGAAERAFGRARGSTSGPYVTWTILALTVGVGASMFLFGQSDVWFELFALDKTALANGEYWRLISPVLVHGSFIHLALNMYALWIIGPIVETLYGSVRFIFLYLTCAAAGSAASFVFSPAVSVGASGAVFGLFGVLLVADRVHKPALTRTARSLTMQIGVLIAINLFIGFSIPRIDNAAHIGGLVAGAWLGAVLVPRGATTLSAFWSRPGEGDGRDRRVANLGRIAAVVVLLGVIAAGVAVGTDLRS